MAVFHVKNTGTKTSGASTAGVWTDANCYSSIQTALNATSAGDSVILDDDIFVIGTSLVSTSLAYDGDVTIISKSGDPTLCSLKSSLATGSVFRTLNTSKSQNFTIQGITLGKTVTHTDNAASPIVQAAQQTGDVHLKDCIVEDVTYSSDRNATGGLFSMVSAAASKTLTLEDVIIRRIRWVNSVKTSYLGTVNDGHTLSVIGTLEIYDIVATGIGFGGFYCAGEINITGEIVAHDIDITGSDSEVALLIQTADSSAALVESIVARRIRVSYATARAAVLDMRGPHTVNAILAEDVHVTASSTTAGLGSVYLSADTTGVGTIGSITARRCSSNYGTAAYLSQGASAVIGSILAEECMAFGGIVYKGGWGDLTLYAYLALNNRQAAPNSSLPAEADAGGLVLYSHVQSAATRNCVCTVWNMTSYNPGITLPPIMLRNVNTSYDMTVVIRNSVLWSKDAAAQIIVEIDAACGIASTLETNVIMGGEASIDESLVAGTHTKSWSGTLEISPAFDSLSAVTAASLIGTARPSPRNAPKDARGRVRRNPPSYGAVEHNARGRIAAIRVAAAR